MNKLIVEIVIKRNGTVRIENRDGIVSIHVTAKRGDETYSITRVIDAGLLIDEYEGLFLDQTCQRILIKLRSEGILP